MTSPGTQIIEGRSGERRLNYRVPISSEIAYEAVFDRRAVQSGCGRTLNVSKSGLLFQAARSLPPGILIELSLAWPAQLDGIAIRLFITGRTVRTSGDATAVRILRYDFRMHRAPRQPAA